MIIRPSVCPRVFQLHCLFLATGLLAAPTLAAASTAFVNEIHYDNDGADSGEAIEIAGSAGVDLAGWALYLYNGNNGSIYRSVDLEGVVPDQQNGFGTLTFSFATSTLQNGSPDGIALVDAADSVVQLLSYEGTFTAVNGPATGLSSMDISVSEADDTPAGFSLQLSGIGGLYEDFAWSGAQNNTFGAVNTGQTFVPIPAALPLFISGIAGIGFFFRGRGNS